jgi:carbon storage regulator CsrA
MLVLSRRRQEAIVIKTLEGDLRVVLLEAEKGRARLGIEAPRGCTVLREELLREIENANRMSVIDDVERLKQMLGKKR